MLDEWVKMCLTYSLTPADFFSGARKIIRSQNYYFPASSVDDTLTLADCGFTKSKQSMLVRNYLNEESRNAAVKLWARRVEQDKYGSVGFSTYNHLIKGGGLRTPWDLSSKITGRKPRPGGTMGGRRRAGDPPPAKVSRASVMGPCIQSVVLTLLPSRKVAIDIFYRTTELFKKFPADLVFLRDVLLPPFKLKEYSLTFHFANITCHPMYFVTIIPHLDDPIKSLERFKRADPKFYEWTVKWTARYLCPEFQRGIQKFAQALRVRDDALRRIERGDIRLLQKYLRANHPGFRGETHDETEEEA